MVRRSRVITRIIVFCVSISTQAAVYAGQMPVTSVQRPVLQQMPTAASTKKIPLALRIQRGAVSMGGEFALQTATDFLFKGSFSPHVVLTHIIATRALQMLGVSSVLSKLPYIGMYLPGAVVQSLTNRVATGQYDPFGVVKGIGAMMMLRKLTPYLLRAMDQEDRMPNVQQQALQPFARPVQQPTQTQPNVSQLLQAPVTQGAVNEQQISSAAGRENLNNLTGFDSKAFIDELSNVAKQLSEKLESIAHFFFGKSIQQIKAFNGIPPVRTDITDKNSEQLIDAFVQAVGKARSCIPGSEQNRTDMIMSLKRFDQFESVQLLISRINQSLADGSMVYRSMFYGLGYNVSVRKLARLNFDPIELVVVSRKTSWE